MLPPNVQYLCTSSLKPLNSMTADISRDNRLEGLNLGVFYMGGSSRIGVHSKTTTFYARETNTTKTI